MSGLSRHVHKRWLIDLPWAPLHPSVTAGIRRAACSRGETSPAWEPRTGWNGRIRVNPCLTLSSAGSCCPWA